NPRPDAVDPDAGERYTDVAMGQIALPDPLRRRRKGRVSRSNARGRDPRMRPNTQEPAAIPVAPSGSGARTSMLATVVRGTIRVTGELLLTLGAVVLIFAAYVFWGVTAAIDTRMNALHKLLV